MGRDDLWPRKVVERSTVVTSRRTRGRRRTCEKDSRFQSNAVEKASVLRSQIPTSTKQEEERRTHSFRRRLPIGSRLDA